MAKGEALNPKHPELTALTQSVGKYALYVAWFAAERALTSTPVTEPPIPSIRESLRTLDIRAALGNRKALDNLVERLEDAYWAACDADPRNESAVLAAFRRARAASALQAALGPNEVQAALDAVYEAYHSLPDDEADPFVDDVKAKLRYYATLP
jgi:hypothetical protein